MKPSTCDLRPATCRSSDYFSLNLPKPAIVKRTGLILILVVTALIFSTDLAAQCSICTRTAAQMGEETGEGLNIGIIYLAAAPLAIAGIIGYKWWKNNR